MREEHDMYAPLVSFFREKGMYVVREVTTHQGRVDVLAVKLDLEAVKWRIANGIGRAVTSPALLRAWQALPARSRPCRIEKWAATLGVQPASLRAHARVLEERGLLVVTTRGFARRTPWPRLVLEVACCEAKLHDWQRGLRQAFGHRFYAHRSYLALARVPRVVDKGLLTARRVGLISVSREGVSEKKKAPRIKPWDALTMRQIEEHVWSDLARTPARLQAALAVTVGPTAAASRPTA